MINISDEAVGLIIKLIEDTVTEKLKLTLISAGAGCGSPAIKIEARQPLPDDIIEEHDGFDLHIRSSITKFIEDAEITVEDTFWGKRLKVITIYGCR